MATGLPERPRQSGRPLLVCEGILCPATPGVPRWLCIPCSSTYCDICWDRQGPHKPGKISLDPRLHEKTNKGVYDRLRIVLDSPGSSKSSDNRAATLWFGMKPPQQADQFVHESCFETRRFNELRGQTSNTENPERARFLVSFLGQAGNAQPILALGNLLTKLGSGISTIIRLLLVSAGADPLREAPVQESAEYDALSGVHLYAAPEEPTSLSLLYADCKGLVDPDAKVEVSANDSPAQSPRPSRRRFSSIFGSIPRESSRPSVELPLHSPQWIMSNIYSHVMYSVSDVIVLVVPYTRYLRA